MHFIANRNNVNNYMLANADAYILGSSSAKISSFAHQSFLPGRTPPLRNPGFAPEQGGQRDQHKVYNRVVSLSVDLEQKPARLHHDTKHIFPGQ